MSYINYAWVHKKLEESGLLRKIEAYKYELTSFWYISEDDLDCYSHNLIEIATPESIKIARKIQDILENKNAHVWQIARGQNIQSSLFPEIQLYGNYTDELHLEPQMIELMFATGANITEILWIDGVKNYKDFWFQSLFEFLFASEIAIHSMQHERYSKEMYRFSRNGFQTQIWGSEHGDFRLFQSDIQEYNVCSPFWNTVEFRPKLEKTVSGYHSIEVMFLSTVLQYAHQVWYDLFLSDFEDFSAQYGNQAGNFWEMWWESFHDKLTLELALSRELASIENQHYNHFIPTAPWNDYNYFIALNWSKLVIGINEHAIKAEFFPDDIPDLIKSLIVQCAHGIGRTSKKRVMDTLRYYFSKELKEELAK